jgi:hypothetical protein
MNLGQKMKTAMFLLAFLIVPPSAQSQSFRIEAFEMDAQKKLRLTVTQDTNSYFRLLAGPETRSVTNVTAISLNNTVLAPSPSTNDDSFFRVHRVALAMPVDSDGDGIDDIWELTHGRSAVSAPINTTVTPVPAISRSIQALIDASPLRLTSSQAAPSRNRLASRSCPIQQFRTCPTRQLSR